MTEKITKAIQKFSDETDRINRRLLELEIDQAIIIAKGEAWKEGFSRATEIANKTISTILK